MQKEREERREEVEGRGEKKGGSQAGWEEEGGKNCE